MARILHLMIRQDDFAAKVAADQKSQGHEVTIVDLTLPNPNYEDVVKHIFAADSVETG